MNQAANAGYFGPMFGSTGASAAGTWGSTYGNTNMYMGANAAGNFMNQYMYGNTNMFQGTNAVHDPMQYTNGSSWMHQSGQTWMGYVGNMANNQWMHWVNTTESEE